MATASSVHLDTGYSGDFLRNQWLGTDFFFFFFFFLKLQIQDVSLSLILAQTAHVKNDWFYHCTFYGIYLIKERLPFKRSIEV